MVERPDDAPMPPAGTAPTMTDPVVDLYEVLLRPRVSARRRAARAGVVLAVVVVAVGLLLRAIWPAPQGTTAVLPTPTPPAVVITSNVTFGTLTVNGRTLTGAPLLLVTRLFHVGTNVVTLAAPPFHARTCHVLFPPASDQLPPEQEPGCVSGVYGGGRPIVVQGVRVVPDAYLDLELSAADLPPDLAAQAVGVVTQALAAVPLHTVVPTGQYYATGIDSHEHIAARRAATPLQAAVLFSMPQPGIISSCGVPPLCGAALDPQIPLPAGQRIWSVDADLTASWRYTAPSGRVTVAPGFPSFGSVQVFLAYNGANAVPGWSVVTPVLLPPLADQLTAGLCQVGATLVDGLGQAAQNPNSSSIRVPDNRGVAGCAIQVVQGSTGSTVLGTFLWRFGVLLAVDQGAHMLAPWLPIAPPAEIAAVEG
jgi:hypothetical protein